MKILYICTQPDLSQHAKSGPGTHMREMIAAFRKLGHEVRTEIEGDRHYSEESGYRVPPPAGWKKMIKSFVPGKVWRSLKDRRLYLHNKAVEDKLRAAINEYQPDVIYERASFLQYITATLAEEAQITHVLEINAPFASQRRQYFGSSFYYKKGLAMEKHIVSKAQRIAVVSGVLRDYYQHAYPVTREKIVVTPNAVNPDHLQFNEAKADVEKRILELEGKLVIGFVGSIFRYHGVEMLVDVLPAVVSEFSSAHLLIVGDGENLSDLKTSAALKGMSEKVTFTGSVPPNEVFHWINAMDITVLPSTGDYMSPIKLFEYGALGKAIIAPDTAPVREVMTDGKDGLLIQQNESSLKQALLRLIKDENLRKEMGSSFQKKVLAEHTWEKMAEKILKGVQA